MPQEASKPAASVIFVPDGEVRARPTDLFPDTPRSAWDMHPDLIDATGRLVFSVGAHLVITPHCTALVDLGLGESNSDTATGATYRSGRLLANLAAAGVTPRDVDLVVFTHLHRDHVGWTSAGGPTGRKIIFDRARHVVHRAEWHHWQRHPSPLGPDRNAVLDPLGDIIEFCEDGDRLAPDLQVIATPGHTPGHLSVLVDLGHGRSCVIAGDVLHSPAQLSHPEWCFGSDLDPEQAAETRRRLLDTYGSEILACAHFAEQAGPWQRPSGTRRSATWQM